MNELSQLTDVRTVSNECVVSLDSPVVTEVGEEETVTAAAGLRLAGSSPHLRRRSEKQPDLETSQVLRLSGN